VFGLQCWWPVRCAAGIDTEHANHVFEAPWRR
jgi:hypothetical protein